MHIMYYSDVHHQRIILVWGGPGAPYPRMGTEPGGRFGGPDYTVITPRITPQGARITPRRRHAKGFRH